MKNMVIRTLIGLAGFILFVGIIIFAAAGSWQFWAGWVYLLFLALCVTFITFYFLWKDPELVQRRANYGPAAEKETSQKIIQSFFVLLFIALFALPGLDFRFQWSQVPLWLVVLAYLMMLLGLIIVFWVLTENSYTASTIVVEQGQTVITTGPYQWVRHPMYLGSFLVLIFSPLALASFWGLIVSIPMLIGIVFRIMDEERFLCRNLPGYDDYCKKTRYHLIPFIW